MSQPYFCLLVEPILSQVRRIEAPPPPDAAQVAAGFRDPVQAAGARPAARPPADPGPRPQPGAPRPMPAAPPGARAVSTGPQATLAAVTRSGPRAAAGACRWPCVVAGAKPCARRQPSPINTGATVNVMDSSAILGMDMGFYIT